MLADDRSAAVAVQPCEVTNSIRIGLAKTALAIIRSPRSEAGLKQVHQDGDRDNGLAWASAFKGAV
jgi:hypothetical protein